MKPNASYPDQLETLQGEHDAVRIFIDRIRNYRPHIHPSRLEAYANWYWKIHICPHLRTEEAILQRFFSDDSEIRKRIEEDHADIRELIITIRDDFDWWALELLCKRVERHIGFEEEAFFPYLQQHLHEDELSIVNEIISSRHIEIPEWEDTFWIQPT